MYNAEHEYCVYKHTSPSGKVYIGITGQPLVRRWKYGDGYKGNVHFANAIKKYKWENFKHEILFSGLSLEDAKIKEQELIMFYDSTNREKGYNRSPGGDMISLESREKMKTTRRENGTTERESKRMRAIWDDPQKRARLLEKMRNAPPRTAEQRERLSAALKGKPKSEECKRKISEARKRKIEGDASRKRTVYQISPVDGAIVNTFPTARLASSEIGLCKNTIAAVCRGINYKKQFKNGFYWCYEDNYEAFRERIELNPEITERGTIRLKPEETHMFGKHVSEKCKKAVSDAHRKAVMCIETGVIYRSLKEAAGNYGSDGSGAAISRQICGKSKTAFGHTWKYVEEETA